MLTLQTSTKKCPGCDLELSIENFAKNRTRKDGLQSSCRECVAAYGRKRYEANKDKVALDGKKYRAENKDEIAKRRQGYWRRNKKKLTEQRRDYVEQTRDKQKVYLKKYYADNKDKLSEYARKYYLVNKDVIAGKAKKYRDENKEKKAEQGRKYYQDNKDRFIAYSQENLGKRRLWNNNRYKSNIQFRLAQTLRSRFVDAIHGSSKKGSGVGNLGCPIQEFKVYLESQFVEGMTWDNWGAGPGKWNIDHIMPLSAFDLTDKQHILLACHFRNLQPLWFEDNQRKADKVPTWENYRDIHKVTEQFQEAA